ncbi:MAG: excinuclease ABC subunit UvrC [Candidatus Omnitrophota bacterium]
MADEIRGREDTLNFVAEKVKSVPETPGVYFFKDHSRKIIYIGKAVNLKRRVSGYFRRGAMDPRIRRMSESVRDIDYLPTSSEAEALIYEASLIHQHKPRYNIALKDDKSYPFLKLTAAEKYPRLIVVREKIHDGSLYYGPYTSARLLRKALSFMKRVFPLRTCNMMPKRPCLNHQIGQCLAPCVKRDADTAYGDIVRDVRLFLAGRRTTLLKRLSARMKKLSGDMRYEEAVKVRDQIESLSAVVGQSRHSLPLDDNLRGLKDALGLKVIPARIEAFDISNLQGQYAVGSMITFFNAKPLKADYRRYRIKTVDGIDDYSMIREVVKRRYGRLLRERLKMPDLVLIDGGRGHLGTALEVMKELGLRIPVISIAKKKEEVFTASRPGPLALPRRSKALKLIQRIRDEAHRFAVSYHKIVLGKAVIGEGAYVRAGKAGIGRRNRKK